MSSHMCVYNSKLDGGFSKWTAAGSSKSGWQTYTYTDTIPFSNKIANIASAPLRTRPKKT